MTDPAHLAERYVSSEKLGAALGTDRPEAIMYNACVASDRPARLHVEGGPGAGKTSLILTVIGQLARRHLDRPVHPLIVNTGASRDVLRDQSSFLAFVIDLIGAQKHVFASLDPAMLAKASAEAVMSTPGAITHAFGIDAKVANYQATFTPAVETLISTRNPATIEQAFRAILEAVAGEYRPLIVIDDTDHFAGSARRGIDEAALTNLYGNGIHALAEYRQLDLIIAIQPRFRDLPAVTDVESRFGFTRVNVPTLPPASDDLSLARVLERRLKVAGMSDQVGELIDDVALAALQGAYFASNADLRWVLDRADEAARNAAAAGSGRIALAHIQPLLVA